MALWAGSQLNTTASAMMFNQLWDLTSMEIVRKDNGLLYSVLGKRYRDSTPMGGVRFQRKHKVSGRKVEIRLLGKLETPVGTADGTAEIATVTPAYSANAFGAVEFDLTHLTLTLAVPSSELTLIRGNEAKTKDYIKEKYNQVLLSYEAAWGDGINSDASDGFTREKLGNWVHAASDGVSTGETAYADYGVDRSDAANADYRGEVLPNVGALTLNHLTNLKNQIRANGGKAKVAVAGTSIYSGLEVHLQSFAHATHNPEWAEFGSSYWQYAGIIGVQEHRAPEGVLGLLTPETWGWWMSNSGITNGLVADPSRASTYVIPTESWCGLFCSQPSHNGKITGITAVPS